MNRTLFALLIAASCLPACGNPEDAGGFDYDENDYSVADNMEGKGDNPLCKSASYGRHALGGMLLTPSGYKKGYVVIQDEKIESVVTDVLKFPPPADVPYIDTKGIISPGLIDLHNHVAYNYIPLWNSGKKWNNRYQWAGAKAYGPAVKDPYNATKNAKHQCEGVKYGEYRAMVGGTTAIQGSVDLACTRSWVRNVEFFNFCQDKVRQNVLAINSISPDEAKELNDQFTSGKTAAFLVHLAEGIDDSSRAEFEQLRALGLLKPQVVGIHSTALTDAQLQEMGSIGMKIVWSPLSNTMLYGKTTNIPVALKAKVKVALAPDWSPSGSANLLGELKIADRINKEQWNSVITDKQLWQMVTSVPADIIGMGDKIGSLSPGYYADIVVLKGSTSRPYRTFIDAKPEDVQLTLIGGKAVYGSTDMLSAFGVTEYTTVDACGQPRGLVDKDAAVTGGTETLADVTATFTKDGVKDIIPLFQCGAPPDWAFPPAPTK